MTGGRGSAWARRLAKPAVFVLGLMPAGFLAADFLNDNLSANPIDDITDTTGTWTLRFIMITLAVTPLRKITGWGGIARHRRMLGLFAFFYGCCHAATYLWLDKFFEWNDIVHDVGKRPFITAGVTAFSLMIPLALTSWNRMVRWMGGKRWTILHRLVYGTGIAGVVHYLWLVKADTHRPLTYGAILAVLLGYRLWDAFRPKRAPVSETVRKKAMAGITCIAAVLCAGGASAQTWSRITPATSEAPSPRFNMSAVYDKAGGNMLIFGGRNASGALDEVWSFNFDSRVWTNVTPPDTPRPAGRFAHTAVWDAQSERMIVWAGQGDGFYNDVWAFDPGGRSWRRMLPSGTPPNPRYGSAAVYDPAARRLVMFAGFTNAGRFDDTQAYDIGGDAWSDLTPPGLKPEIRCLHTACYDAQGHRMIVYGGQHVGPLGDIWSFDLSGNAWSDLTPSSRPSGRFFATSICAAGRVFVFGGMTASGNSGDVWAFSAADSSWGLVPVSGPLPGPRNSHAAIFVPLEDAMIVFGGTGDTATNDIWMLSGLVSGVRRPFASPAGFGLGQNYPNPFNPSTAIPFRLDEYGPVSLKVFDILGREVEALVEETLAPGRHVRSWDGGAAASGVYMVRLSTPRWRQNRPIVLLR